MHENGKLKHAGTKRCDQCRLTAKTSKPRRPKTNTPFYTFDVQCSIVEIIYYDFSLKCLSSCKCPLPITVSKSFRIYILQSCLTMHCVAVRCFITTLLPAKNVPVKIENRLIFLSKI